VSTDESASPPPDRKGWDRRQIILAAVVGLVVVGIGGLLTIGLLNRDVNNSIDRAIAKGQRAPAPSS
jgi:hypothetical protein